MSEQLNVRITGDSQSLKKATQDGERSLEKLGNTSKQTAAALRGVPAQFTDIFTSLQGGQAPLTVFLQQGGQLKDMFGGIGPAARALGGYVLGLINPFTLAATAATALGAAYYYGDQQSTRLENALIRSGNILGSTRDQLETLTQTAGQLTGAYGLAREAVEALAGSGVITHAQLETTLEGVLAGVELTGAGVDDIAAKFLNLAKDPVKAIVKLNETENFLTLDIYKQIKSLEERGKHQEAANLAIKTYADTLESRKDQVVKNLGSIEKAWRSIKSTASAAWNAMLGIGTDDTIDEKIKNIQQRLNAKVGRAGQYAVPRVSGETRNTRGGNIYAESEYESLTKELAALERQKKAQDATATAAAQKSINNKKAIEEAEAASKKPKTNKDEDSSDYWASRMADLGAFGKQVEALDDVEMTRAETMQRQLDGYVALEPALKKYWQGLIDVAKAQEAQDKNDKLAMQQADNAQKYEANYAKQLSEKNAQFLTFSQELEQQNKQLNIDLIEDDKARAQAQLALEVETAKLKIATLGLSLEQEQALIEQVTQNYELQLKGIDKKLDDTQSIGKELGLTFKSAFEDGIVSGKKFGDVVSGLAQDIERLFLRRNVTEPLFKALDGIDFGDMLGSAPQGEAGTGSGLMGWLSGLFGGGLATGGKATAGKFYEVNENSPELYTQNGRTYLMMGAQDGKVTPPNAANGLSGAAGGVVVNLVEAPNSGKSGQVQTSQDNGNLTITMFVERIKGEIANDIFRGTGIAPSLEQTYGLNRAAGARG